MQRIIRPMLVLLLSAGLALWWLAGTAQAASNRNHANCLRWCSQNPDQCDQCRKSAGCGAGWKQIKVFRGRGHNWHACKRRDSDWQRRNLRECDQWCSQNKPLCLHCSTAPGCGANKRSIKSFRGRGKNWYACANTRTPSYRNENQCKGWCSQNRDRCARCSRKPGCGAGYKTIRRFTGKGDNWYACQDRGGSESNYQKCDRYCRFYNNRCVGCSTKPGCGAGKTAMKAFRGRGKNWYACQRSSRGGPLRPAR